MTFQPLPAKAEAQHGVCMESICVTMRANQCLDVGRSLAIVEPSKTRRSETSTTIGFVMMRLNPKPD